MALVATARLNFRVADSSGALSGTSGSFTPSDASLLVVLVGAVDRTYDFDSANSTLSGGSLEWTKRTSFREDASSGDYNHMIEIWTAPVTTGAAMTLTWTNTSGTATDGGITMQAVDISGGYDTDTPTGGKVAASIGDDGAQSVTLDASPGSTSIVVAGRLVESAGSEDIGATHGSGWTELYDVPSGGTPGYACLQSQYILNLGSTTVPWDDVDTNATDSVALSMACAGALEIKAAGGDAAIQGLVMSMRSDPIRGRGRMVAG